MEESGKGVRVIIILFRLSENNIFGVSLSTLIQNDRQKDAAVQVPIVFEDVSRQSLTSYNALTSSLPV